MRHHRHDILIRLAASPDEDALIRLAALDSADPLQGPALMGFVGGEPRAAVALADGRTVADPFAPTADLVDLLRLQAKRLAPAHGGPAGDGRRRRTPLRRSRRRALAPAA